MPSAIRFSSAFALVSRDRRRLLHRRQRRVAARSPRPHAARRATPRALGVVLVPPRVCRSAPRSPRAVGISAVAHATRRPTLRRAGPRSAAARAPRSTSGSRCAVHSRRAAIEVGVELRRRRRPPRALPSTAAVNAFCAAVVRRRARPSPRRAAPSAPSRRAGPSPSSRTSPAASRAPRAGPLTADDRVLDPGDPRRAASASALRAASSAFLALSFSPGRTFGFLRHDLLAHRARLADDERGRERGRRVVLHRGVVLLLARGARRARRPRAPPSRRRARARPRRPVRRSGDCSTRPRRRRGASYASRSACSSAGIGQLPSTASAFVERSLRCRPLRPSTGCSLCAATAASAFGVQRPRPASAPSRPAAARPLGLRSAAAAIAARPHRAACDRGSASVEPLAQRASASTSAFAASSASGVQSANRSIICSSSATSFCLLVGELRGAPTHPLVDAEVEQLDEEVLPIGRLVVEELARTRPAAGSRSA